MPEQEKPPLSSLLVKPTSWGCNLRCRYCFYLRTEAMYPGPKQRMSEQVLERMIRDYQAIGGDTINYGWQGGEPLLMEREFFHSAFRLQERHRHNKQVIANSIQTNGILIDAAWVRLFAGNRCLIGISLDGPPKVHDHYRGKGTHKKVLNAIHLMTQARVQFNILTVLNDRNVKMKADLYRYLRDLGVQWMQFIPIIEPSEDGTATAFSVTSEEYGEFMLAVFEEWQKHDVGRISVRTFDSMVLHAAGRKGLLCLHDGTCDAYLVVEHNGDVYPCDFFVKPEWKVGSLLEFKEDTNAFAELLKRGTLKKFREHRCLEECSNCKFVEICEGGCQKDRLVRVGTLGGGLEKKSPFCTAYQKFYSKTLPFFNHLARNLTQQKERDAQP